MRRRRRSVEATGQTRTEQRTGAKAARTDAKANLILAKSEKAKQTAAKRKWLVFLLGMVMAIAAFFKFKIGP